MHSLIWCFCVLWVSRFFPHLYYLVGCLSMIVWTHAVLGVLYACVLYFSVCTCSAQLSMFHVERCSRNTIIIVTRGGLFTTWSSRQSSTELKRIGKVKAILMIVIIAFKGANRHFFLTIFSLRCELSPTCTLKWPGGTIVDKARATHRTLVTCNMCNVPRGTKGQLSY